MFATTQYTDIKKENIPTTAVIDTIYNKNVKMLLQIFVMQKMCTS